MGIVIANNPLIVSVMQGQRILNAMRNMRIDRTSESTEFYPEPIIHWKHLTIKIKQRIKP